MSDRRKLSKQIERIIEDYVRRCGGRVDEGGYVKEAKLRADKLAEEIAYELTDKN